MVELLFVHNTHIPALHGRQSERILYLESQCFS